MTTDSRSFLSCSRHGYFRRLLCNVLGEDVRRGRLPGDQRCSRTSSRTSASSTRGTTSAFR